MARVADITAEFAIVVPAARWHICLGCEETFVALSVDVRVCLYRLWVVGLGWFGVYGRALAGLGCCLPVWSLRWATYCFIVLVYLSG